MREPLAPTTQREMASGRWFPPTGTPHCFLVTTACQAWGPLGALGVADTREWHFMNRSRSPDHCAQLGRKPFLPSRPRAYMAYRPLSLRLGAEWRGSEGQDRTGRGRQPSRRARSQQAIRDSLGAPALSAVGAPVPRPPG